jgi:hypothetical protein
VLLDCSVDLRIAGVPIRTRIAVVDDALPQQLGRGEGAPLELYATAHQNLSIRRTRQ